MLGSNMRSSGLEIAGFVLGYQRVTAEDPAVETLKAQLASFWPIVTDFSSASSLWNNHTEVLIGSV